MNTGSVFNNKPLRRSYKRNLTLDSLTKFYKKKKQIKSPITERDSLELGNEF